MINISINCVIWWKTAFWAWNAGEVLQPAMPKPQMLLLLRYTFAVSLFELLSVFNPCRRYLAHLSFKLCAKLHLWDRRAGVFDPILTILNQCAINGKASNQGWNTQKGTRSQEAICSYPQRKPNTCKESIGRHILYTADQLSMEIATPGIWQRQHGTQGIPQN